jgi:protein SHQ1
MFNHVKNNIIVGVFTIVVPKETPGEIFEGLDMLTSLLTPKSHKHKGPVIEVVGNGKCFCDSM